jgi:hypothetical protein
VLSNDKQRYDLILEGPDGEILETVCPRTDARSAVTEKSALCQSLKNNGVWLIRARQGHSMKVRQSNIVIWTYRNFFIEGPAGDETYSFTL